MISSKLGLQASEDIHRPDVMYALIFDMDGVIIDSEPMQLQAFNEALKPHGVELSQADFIGWCVGRKSRENFAFLREHFGLAESVEGLLAAKNQAYEQILRKQIRPMPGLFSLLRHLKRLRLPLAVASSSQRADIELVLESLGIRADFAVVISGEEVAHGKPAPDIFLEAARHLGVEPISCMVLEDTQTGIEAAVRAGMRSIAVPNAFTRGQDFSRATYRVRNLEEVKPFVSLAHTTKIPADSLSPISPKPSSVRVPVRLFSPYDKHKMLMHSDRIRKMLRGHMIDPVTIDIEPTNVCNHNCFWCYNRDFRFEHPDTLPEEIMLSLLDSLQGSEVKGVIFSGGGEPLLHPSIDTALLRVAEIGLSCCLYTNGSSLREHMDAVSRGCQSLNVSLDAGARETHLFMHKPGKSEQGWEDILESLHLMKERSPHIVINVSYVIHAQNYYEIYRLSRNLRQAGADSLHIKPMIKYNAHVTPKMMEELKEQVESAKEELPVSVTGPGLTTLKSYPDRCRATPLKALVAADGKLYVCCRRREAEYCLGDLRKQDFWTIWRNDEHRSILAQIVPSRCGECPQVEYNDTLDHAFEADEMQANFL